MGAADGVHGHTAKHIAHKRVQTLPEAILRERLLAEFVGTFFLVLTIGVGVAGGGPLAPVAIGLVLGIQIFTFGAVSGAFFNPAVALAVLLTGRGKISRKDTALYVVVESLAAALGACISYAVTGSTFCFNYDAWGTSFLLEMLFTAVLGGAVLTTGTSNDAPNHYFGFAIGMSVTAGALASGGFDQGSFNPAVTFGINFANYLNSDSASHPSIGSWFLFLLAPLLGGALAAGIFVGTRGNEYGGGVAVEGEREAGRASEEREVVAEA